MAKIEAAQWFKNGDHPEDYAQAEQTQNSTQTFSSQYRKEHEWEGNIVRYFRHPDIPDTQPCSKCGHTTRHHGWIDTKEGGSHCLPW